MTAPLHLLFADTARSRAYAQALRAARVAVSSAMLVRSPDRRRWGQTAAAPPFEGHSSLPVPDLSIELADTLADLTPNVETSESGSLNSDDVVQWRSDSPHGLVVFSGFGGEIVDSAVIESGAPMLHLHSGDLPHYRGSTTMYYSLLAGAPCTVTAILLDEHIDTGPVVGKRHFAPPPPGMDLDYLYDPAIRAATLIDVLTAWRDNGDSFPNQCTQPSEGTTYYIIHPVLKHVAILNLEARVA